MGLGPFKGEGREEKKIEQDQFMIQLCLSEDFPVSRTGLARLKGPTAQTERFLYLSSGLCVEVCFMSCKVTRIHQVYRTHYNVSMQGTHLFY